MPENKIQIVFEALISNLQASLDQARTQVQTTTSQMNESFSEMASKTESSVSGIGDKIKSQFESIASSISIVKNAVALLIASFAIHEIERVVGSYISFVEQVHHLSDAFGISTERATTYAIALKEIGMDADTYSMAFRRMVQHLKESPEAFDRLKVTIRDSNGEMLSAEEVMRNVIKRIGEFKPGIDQVEVASDLLGMRINNVQEFLRLTDERMAHAAKTQEQLGLTITKDGVNKLFEYQESIADMGLAWTKFAGSVSSIVIPILSKLADALNFVTEAVRNFPLNFGTAMSAMYGGPIPETGGGGFKGIHGNEPIILESYVPKPKKTEAGAEKSEMAVYEAELLAKKRFFAESAAADGAYYEMSLAEERAYWEQILATIHLSEYDKLEIKRKIDALRLAELKAAHKEELKDEKDFWAEVEKMNDAERERIKEQGRQNIENLKAQYANLKNIFTPFTQAFQTSVNGVIQGTITLRKAFQNLGQSILAELVNSGIKVLVDKIGDYVACTLLGISAADAQTLALAKQEKTVWSLVTAYLALAAAELIAGFAGGGEVAGAPSGGGGGGVPGVSVSTQHGYDVPGNVTARLHAREMVLPADLADRIRNMTEPTGKINNVNLSFKINAMDSKDVERALKDHQSGVHRALSHIKRNYNF